MFLIKDYWEKNDIKEFNEYLLSFQNKEKIKWTKNIVNTKLNVLAIKTNILNNIAKEILKGNYISFLDNMEFNTHENTIIYAKIINKIKDIKIQKKYLDIYSDNIDNWASTDSLKIEVKSNKEEYKKIVKKYIKSNKIFKRRTGIIILFSFLKEKETNFIFEILNELPNEQEYYVNMAISWLLCECMIKEKEKTIKYLNNNPINEFTKKKFFQKCRDSFRINNKDLELIK